MKHFPLLLAFVLAGLCCLGPVLIPHKHLAGGDGPAAVVVTLRGDIDDFARANLARRLDAAKALNAQIVILEIDTYGGGVRAGLDISRLIKSRQEQRIVAFINDKAISAGAMIALACDEIVMTPQSSIGDCAPIAVAGDQLVPMPAAERAKTESPILADFLDSATRRGHDPLVAQSMVAVGRTVHFIQKGDIHNFVTDEELPARKSDGWTIVPGVPDPLDSAETLLTLPASLALKIGLASEVVPSVDALALSRGWNITATLDTGIGERIIDFLNSTAVRAILMIIFSTSLYWALHIPGHGPPEAICVTALCILLGVPLLTGYAQWYEILAIVIGMALVAFEIFVFPGHFVGLAAGLVLVVGGLVMTFVPKEPDGLPGILPALGATWTALRNGLLVVVIAMAASTALCAWISRYLPNLPYFNKLVLNTIAGDGASASITGASYCPGVGERGLTLTPLMPGGSVEFKPSTGPQSTISLPVVCERGYLEANQYVIVTDISNNRIVVRAAPQTV